MKIFKGKAFFFKSVLIYIFLVFVISCVSVIFWENPTCDFIIKNIVKAKPHGSGQIELVMIDNKSIETYRWPWARSLYGEALEYFNDYTNARVVVFDAIVTNLDTANPPESDLYFFNSVKKSKKYISGYKFQTTQKDLEYIPDDVFNSKFKYEITDLRTKNKDNYNIYKSISPFPKAYFDSLKHVGSVNFITDPIDGVLRSSSDVIFYNGNYYPSLSLATYLFINDTDKFTLTDKYIIVDKTGLKIPVLNTSYDTKHFIKYHKPYADSLYTHKKYSAIDIIESYRQIKKGQKPLISPAEFDNKIVVFGANAMNAEDTLRTPISLKQPGADVQATIIDNMISEDFMIPLSVMQNIFIILFLSFLTFVVISNLQLIPALLVLIFCGIVYLLISILLIANNIIPYTITPLAVQLGTMIFGYSYRFILEGRNKEKIKNAMGKYLSQDIMKNVVQNIDDIKLGGKKSNLTVLFSDIRGFTSMSEKMSAEEVSMILNEYFSEMEPIITKYNGVINKFIGDAVMAIFGEPIQDINHAQNAVKCACEMLKKVEQLREKWLAEGKPKIEIGIGINTGEAFVGNIGSEKRLEYTVIGDTVNLASRIEGYNKVYKTNLLISSSTYSKVSDIVNVIKIADVTIRGKAKKMDIYEVLDLS